MNDPVRRVLKKFGDPYKPYGAYYATVLRGKYAGEMGKLWFVGVSRFDKSQVRVLLKMADDRWVWFAEDAIDITNTMLWEDIKGTA